jgi:predicted GNAT family acetyltransferase
MADVRDNPKRSRFEIYLDGEQIGLMTYRIVGDTVIILHAEIAPRHGRQGYGHELVQSGLDQIRAEGHDVDPQCPFVRAFIEKTPDYRDLIKEH